MLKNYPRDRLRNPKFKRNPFPFDFAEPVFSFLKKDFHLKIVLALFLRTQWSPTLSSERHPGSSIENPLGNQTREKEPCSAQKRASHTRPKRPSRLTPQVHHSTTCYRNPSKRLTVTLTRKYKKS